MKQEMNILIEEKIAQKIFVIRGTKVMLDRDLAALYDIETKALNQAVKRNFQRFPIDFMFQLTAEEFNTWKSQIVTSNADKMGLRKLPYAFTEHGILMLSSVLNSNKAIEVNIQIMRAFTKLRELMVVHKDLRIKIEEMESKYDAQFQIVFKAIKRLIDPPKPRKPKIPFGFHQPSKNI